MGWKRIIFFVWDNMSGEYVLRDTFNMHDNRVEKINDSLSTEKNGMRLSQNKF